MTMNAQSGNGRRTMGPTTSNSGGGSGTVQSVTGSATGIVDNTDPANPIILPQFGSNTLIKLPNSAAAMIDALQLVESLSDNTAGAEKGLWTIRQVAGGVLFDALIIDRAGHMGVVSDLFFIYDPDTGIVNSAPNTVAIKIGGNEMLFVNALGALLRSDLGSNIGYQWTGYLAGTFFNSITGHIRMSPHTDTGNVDLGLASGTLANNATHGFITFPTCAGTPTNPPDNVTAGQAACIIGNFPAAPKMYTWDGAAWVIL